ncbi:hypothetical protein DL764_010777 [Monosporascus ibericus]|uniref:Uncharacterized protein n=1 Tax=Monosporascus ibericus TaxID=155417 RepID=A0A4Q4SS45_9PEZI|nr:hypothetical protein DL764_010777 [Monosporascus ibericus]
MQHQPTPPHDVSTRRAFPTDVAPHVNACSGLRSQRSFAVRTTRSPKLPFPHPTATAGSHAYIPKAQRPNTSHSRARVVDAMLDQERRGLEVASAPRDVERVLCHAAGRAAPHPGSRATAVACLDAGLTHVDVGAVRQKGPDDVEAAPQRREG